MFPMEKTNYPLVFFFSLLCGKAERKSSNLRRLWHLEAAHCIALKKEHWSAGAEWVLLSFKLHHCSRRSDSHVAAISLQNDDDDNSVLSGRDAWHIIDALGPRKDRHMLLDACVTGLDQAVFTSPALFDAWRAVDAGNKCGQKCAGCIGDVLFEQDAAGRWVNSVSCRVMWVIGTG